MNNQELVSKLLAMNVNDMTEKKNGLTYLSWASAWGEVLKVDPEANYKVKLFDGMPFCGNNKIGYMVFTELTINGLTRECYLPVMDYKNKSILDNLTTFDVNKTIQRCLAKNIAMFGLGLYIYKGEDLPEEAEASEPVTKPITQPQKELIFKLNCNIENVCQHFHVDSIDDLTSAQAAEVIRIKRGQR